MKKIILLIILVVISLTACTQKHILGGDSDEYGCKPSTGFVWNEKIQACTRDWELDESQIEAAKVAVDYFNSKRDALVYTTIIEVETIRCLGCFNVKMMINNQESMFEITLAGWVPSGPVFDEAEKISEKPCTREYFPVCCNDKSYPNICLAENAGETDCYEGLCPEEECIKGEKICTMEYDPVCCNGIVYSNYCMAMNDCAVNCVQGECI